jgi:hypothetical protein
MIKKSLVKEENSSNGKVNNSITIIWLYLERWEMEMIMRIGREIRRRCNNKGYKHMDNNIKDN